MSLQSRGSLRAENHKNTKKHEGKLRRWNEILALNSNKTVGILIKKIVFDAGGVASSI